MHYFIDGYNLLFRHIPHSQDDLQNQRQSIILDLNTKISLLKLDVSIVFDANSQMGERSRSHYNALEIIFTAEGETADEYILNEIKNTPYPEQETVVTSDKALAWRVRNRLAHTESVEGFILWLNRSYKNKKRQTKKEQGDPLPRSTLPSQSTSSPLVKKNIPLEGSADYYAQIFESEWKKILEEEQAQKQEIPSRKISARKSRGIHPTPTLEEEDGTTDMERWLKIFEKKLSDEETF